MQSCSLNGSWLLNWSTGQRGGTPYVIKHQDNHQHTNEVLNLKRDLPGQPDTDGWIPASVPGEVHLDLLKQGILEDPHFGINVFKARWVEECVWFYTRTFDAPDEAVTGPAIITLDQVYLTAIVYLNGEEIGRHSNSFCPLICDVTGKLKRRGNTLLVRVESGLFENADKPVRTFNTATATMDVLLTKRMWLRIPQCHTEWDWSARMLNVGLSGDVTLRWDSHLIVSPVSLRQTTPDDLSEATVEARLFAENRPAGDAAHYELELEIDGKKAVATFTGLPKDGFAVKAVVRNPRLWNPIGMGQQTRYDVCVKLLRDGRVITDEHKKIGFRNVRVIQDAHPEKGHYFYFTINGRPTFMKGSNFVPADMITAAITRERYEKLIDLALEAHFNILRVWGGGLYESDTFYDLCDEKGLLVWQEFISACCDLPLNDTGFIRSVTEETVYNVRRLSSHPSLIAWCGNNENDPSPDWYRNTLRELIHREDPEKYYQPASPYTDISLPNVPADADTQWPYAGDQHPWDVGFTDKDHRKYFGMACRFANEGGALGPVTPSVMRSCLTGWNEQFYHDPGWKVHDNMLASWMEGSSPDNTLAFWLNKKISDFTLDAYAYAGGFLQSEAVTAYIDNFRRRAFDSSAAIFWMYNDCWPCSRSWTVVDYALHRTPSFYGARRAFADVRVIPVEQDGKVTFFGVNSSDAAWCGKLRFGVFTCDGHYLHDETLDVVIPANCSLALPKLDPWTPGVTVPFGVLLDPCGNEVSRNRLLTQKFTEYSFAKPQITTTFSDGVMTLSSPVFVPGVCLDLEGIHPLADNLFDLFPGQPVSLPLDEEKPILYTLIDIL